MVMRLLRALGVTVVLALVLVSPRQGFVALLGVLALYLALVVAVASSGQLLMYRSPAWATRFTRLLGLLTASQDHRITLLAIHKENPAQADRIWQEVEPKLAGFSSAQAMALASNYCASLSFRGEYRRARDLMLQYPPGLHTRQYAAFYALYWLNLGWFHYQLEDFQALEDCLRHAAQERITHPQTGERLEGLQALLAYERGDQAGALRVLIQHSRRQAFSAWLLSEMGEKQLAAERLPDPESVTDLTDQAYYHLAQATLTGQPEHLDRAAATGYAPGHVAYHALKHFQNDSYLALAEEKDPESLFTQRALADR